MSLFDIQAQVLAAALKDIHAQLRDFARRGIMRGQLNVQQQVDIITVAESVRDCVCGAAIVQVVVFCF